MKRVRPLFLTLLTVAMAGCAEAPVEPPDQTEAAFAKGSKGKPGGGGGEASIVFHYVEAGDYRGSGALTCGLDDAGKAYCWGYNPNGWLGIGSTRKSAVKTPQPVLGGLTFSDLTVASKHICAIDAGALAWCWGVNAYGQVGAGSDETVVSEPAAVVGGLAFSDLSAGQFHTCGVGPDGYAYCWGWNYSGQLGDGTTTDRNVPVAVLGGLQFAKIFTGGGNTCGILETGETYCWGMNTQGQLGIGTVSGPHASPVLIPGGRRFESLAISDYQSKCGLTSDADPLGAGGIVCWGDTENGGSPIPTEIDPGAAAGDLPFRALVGRFCAIGASDQAYCWGENDYGQIGDGEQSAGSAVPSAVGSPGQFESIGGKGVHTCGIGLDGYAYCWGWNTYGELGDGTNKAKNSPVRVDGQ